MFENNEIIDSVKSCAKERLGNIMFGTFFLSWCAWNWKAVYITIFIDQNLLFQTKNVLKIEYLYNLYSINSFTSFLNISLKTLIGPIISTWLIIWPLSKIDFLCAKKHYSSKIKKEAEKIKQQNELLTKKQNVLEKQEKTVLKQKQIIKEMPAEDKWLIELQNNNQNVNFRKAMEFLEEALYTHKGKIVVYGDFDSKEFEIPPQYIAYLDTNELIDFSGPSREKITLTNKGKFFLKKYIQDKHKFIE